MKKIISFLLVLVLSIACFTGCGSSDNGQTSENTGSGSWPEKTITMVIGYSAGGTADVVARMVAKGMQEYLGKEISCINVEGASASVAGQQVYDAPADGYTIFGGLAHSASGWKMCDYADIGWDDFYGMYAATSPYILFVNSKSNYNTYQDLISDMKANPGKLKWGNAGLGSINHLTGEIFLDTIGAEAVSLPYGGGREAAIKVIADEVQFSWAGASDVMDLATTGQIKVLGVVSKEDMVVKSTTGEYTVPSLLNDYPELSSLEGLLNWGIAIKRDTPDDVIVKLQEAFEYAVQQDEFKELCESRFLEPDILVGQESDEKSAYLESVYAWGLYENGLSAEGIKPEDFGILAPENYSWPPNDEIANIKPWPTK